jgi:hypothetical protein
LTCFVCCCLAAAAAATAGKEQRTAASTDDTLNLLVAIFSSLHFRCFIFFVHSPLLLVARLFLFVF